MLGTKRARPTVGVLVSWQVYHGARILRYQHTVLQGIYASAAAHDCNLLLACGMYDASSPGATLSAWPTMSDFTNFVPVGPWNTDGLIVLGMYLNSEQEVYLRGLTAAGHPLVFTGFEGPGLFVNIDNADGIRQALEHLHAHGHQRIAFIAGVQTLVGESRPRLQAYQDVTRRLGLASDPRLIAYGDLSAEGGYRAMQQILAGGVPFTAVLASNDSSCFGAAAALREHGLRIPDDVAMIGFDDLLEAQAHMPPFTTVYNPAFAMGRQSLRTLLDVIAGRPTAASVQVPVRLVVRRSCGCGRDTNHSAATTARQPIADSRTALVQAMDEAVLLEARTSPDEVEALCHSLVDSFIASIHTQQGAAFEQTLLDLLQRIEALEDDAHAWYVALSTLRQGLADFHPPLSASTQAFAEQLLARARRIVGERTRQQAARVLLSKEHLADRLGQMSAQLLMALTMPQIQATLSQHLPQLDVPHILGAWFVPDNDDPLAQSEIMMSYGVAGASEGQRFNTRQFPPPELYAIGRSFQLALLPLEAQELRSGFVVFDAANLEPCAAIVRNLAAALRASQLYAEALHGRQQAEEANKLKSRFLSVVSHELRTPLNLIVALSELLLQQQPALQETSTTIASDLERIYTSAHHLGQLIGDVLDLASSEAGQLHLLREPLDLSDVLAVVAVTGAHMAREKGLHWEAQLPTPGPWIMGDRTRLRQIVLNLVSNAVKFTSIGSVTLTLGVEGDTARIVVSDTGLGVPVDEQARIFSEFQRAERTIARGYAGLGLGLSICSQLIALHSGTIRVESTGIEGEGTTFIVSLPLLAKLPTRWIPEVAFPEQERPIVLLTSHGMTTAPLEMYLSQHGLVATVKRVDVEMTWLPSLLAAPPRVIVLDATLAVQQGWQFVAALQRHQATSHIPLVVCTLDPHTEQGVFVELHYQVKPLDALHLTQILSTQGLLTGDEAGTQTILVVDDDATTLDLHTRLLEQQATRYRVLQAHNGREALTIARQTRPDLVLLDLLMPELDGFGVLEELRANEITRDVPVVVLTAQTLTEAEMERLNRGVAAVLSKGIFRGEEIQAHVESILARTYKLSIAAQGLVRKALVYIHSHYMQPLSRAQIASYVGISADYLTVCFQQELGISPIAYLQRYRIKQARELLEAGQLSVTAVALAVGFADSTYFGRVFQREVGVTPSAYRRGQRDL